MYIAKLTRLILIGLKIFPGASQGQLEFWHDILKSTTVIPLGRSIIPNLPNSSIKINR